MCAEMKKTKRKKKEKTIERHTTGEHERNFDARVNVTRPTGHCLVYYVTLNLKKTIRNTLSSLPSGRLDRLKWCRTVARAVLPVRRTLAAARQMVTLIAHRYAHRPTAVYPRRRVPRRSFRAASCGSQRVLGRNNISPCRSCTRDPTTFARSAHRVEANHHPRAADTNVLLRRHISSLDFITCTNNVD